MTPGNVSGSQATEAKRGKAFVKNESGRRARRGMKNEEDSSAAVTVRNNGAWRRLQKRKLPAAMVYPEQTNDGAHASYAGDAITFAKQRE